MMKVVVALALASGAAAQLKTPPTFRSKCDGEQHKPLGRDMRRAHQIHQTERVGGRDHAEISHKINKATVEATDAPQKDCSEFSLEELNQMIRDMSCHMNPHLAKAYHTNEDRHGKRDGRQLRHSTIEEYEKSWEAELAKVAEDETVAEILRDAKCAEALMIFSHHLPEPAKDTLVNEQAVVLPTLPVFNETHAEHDDDEVAQVYDSSYTCQTGHGMTEATTTGSDHILPHWPTNVHYTGTGYGAYPFWGGGEGTGESGPIEVYWSEEQAAERFYHEGCYLDEFGYGTGSTPCFHLMKGVLGSSKAYMYSADGEFCCESTGSTEDLPAPQSDFMDDMTFEGTYSNVETAYYSGEAYWYTETLGNSEAVSAFWYATTPEGYPLQQGEGGYGPNDASGKGIFIYHEYNYTAWLAESGKEIDESIFEVPEICQTTTRKCAFP